MFCPKCGQENPPGSNYCSRCGTVLTPVGTPRPGVGSAFGNGWRTLRKNFADLFLLIIVFLGLVIPVSVVIGLIVDFTTKGPFFSDTWDLYQLMPWQFQLANAVSSILWFVPLSFGLFFVPLTAVRGEKTKLRDLFASFRFYPAVMIAGLFLVVLSGVSFLLELLAAHLPPLGATLFLVWAILYIVLICKLVFVPLLLLDRRMKFTEAFRASWLMTRGHEWQVFAIGVLGVLTFAVIGIIAFLISLIFILFPVALFVGIVVGFIGFIFLLMWLTATYASLYHAVNLSSNT